MDIDLIRRTECWRTQRNANITRAMSNLERAQAKLASSLADSRQARLDIKAAKASLETLIVQGERKVVHNHLLTVNPSGGLHIEPVDVVSLL